MYKEFANIRGAPKLEGVGGLQPPQIKIWKNAFIHDDAEHFVSYSLHPKLATEIG